MLIINVKNDYKLKVLLLTLLIFTQLLKKARLKHVQNLDFDNTHFLTHRSLLF